MTRSQEAKVILFNEDPEIRALVGNAIGESTPVIESDSWDIAYRNMYGNVVAVVTTLETTKSARNGARLLIAKAEELEIPVGLVTSQPDLHLHLREGLIPIVNTPATLSAGLGELLGWGQPSADLEFAITDIAA